MATAWTRIDRCSSLQRSTISTQTSGTSDVPGAYQENSSPESGRLLQVPRNHFGPLESTCEPEDICGLHLASNDPDCDRSGKKKNRDPDPSTPGFSLGIQPWRRAKDAADERKRPEGMRGTSAK